MASDRDPADDVAALADVIETVVRTALAPVVGRLRALETLAATLAPIPDQIAAVAAVAAVPGPPGEPGPPGLGFDDYQIAYDGERTVTHSWARDGLHVEHLIKMPNVIYRGVFVDGKVYERGDCVTVAGSIWHCNADTTTRPGDGAAAWTLAVKRGRDGGGR